MRRTIIGFMSTISALVLLFSYHTSTNSEAAAAGVVSATASTSSSRTSVTGAASASSGSLAATSSGTSASPATTAPTTTTSTTSSAAVSSGNSSGKSSGKSSGTYTGDAVNTRWGLVQVEITVDNGTITAAQAVQYPNENGRDREINSYAVPQLNSEVTAAQSGSIDAVSGATVTSNGYITSLQSAIDQANL